MMKTRLPTDMIEQFTTGTVFNYHEIMTVRLYHLVQFTYVLMQQTFQGFDFELDSR